MGNLRAANGLQSLVDRLTRLERPASIAELRHWLSETTIDRSDLAPYIHFQDSCYCRNPVTNSEHFELLCICWKSGQSSLIHDHLGSACGVRIVDGELSETIFDLVEGSSVRPRTVNHYCAGFVCSSVDRDIHQITNDQPNGRELITVHIYSPPLVAMTSYSLYQEKDVHEAVAP